MTSASRGEVLKDLADLIDWSEPVAIFVVAVLHLLTDADDPWGIVAAFTERLAPGSLVIIGHVTSTGSDPGRVKAIEEIYRTASAPLIFRPQEQVVDLFAGLDLLDPGVVDVGRWPNTDVEQQPLPLRVLAGVGRVPGGGAA